MRVLIVDDHTRYSEVVAARLRRGGHTPMRRSTLKGALDAINRHELATVFIPPSIHGRSTCEIVERLHEHQPDTKVFMLLGAEGEPEDPAKLGLSVNGVRQRGEVSTGDAAALLGS
ncbi:MAG: hypothetical protein KDH09_19330 [Chrysiogenetes bacterium]|nr:hypothetical protein [Chrysiogenetes bacterium]